MEMAMRFLLPEWKRQIVVTGKVVYIISRNPDQSIIAHPLTSDKEIAAMPGIRARVHWMSDADREAIRTSSKKTVSDTHTDAFQVESRLIACSGTVK